MNDFKVGQQYWFLMDRGFVWTGRMISWDAETWCALVAVSRISPLEIQFIDRVTCKAFVTLEELEAAKREKETSK